MNKFIVTMLCGAVALGSCAKNEKTESDATDNGQQTADSSVVYMTREISPEAIIKLYKALGREAKGKVAIKISTGEPGGHNFLQPALIKDFVELTNGTIVECNTAYAGKLDTADGLWENLAEQDDFLESMAEAAKAIADHCGDNILYISVANNLSVDCDCDSSPADPQMHDIGILASLDPVALDKACTDLVRSSDDHGKIHLIERIDSRHGMHTLDHAEALGLGSQTYKLVNLD